MKLQRSGLRPVVVVLEECPFEQWEAREIHWYRYFTERGERLTNVAVWCGRGSRLHIMTHGGAGTREYIIWFQIRSRCSNPEDRSYHKYGGRGITLCERWLEFENFRADVGLAPSRTHVLHRLDKAGHYEPGNCAWMTPAEGRRLAPRSSDGRAMVPLREEATRLGIGMEVAQGWIRHGHVSGTYSQSRTWFVVQGALEEFLRTQVPVERLSKTGGSAERTYHTNARLFDGITSPEGVTYTGVTNLRTFCREHGLNYCSMSLVYHGKIISHKGWICTRPEAQEALRARKWKHSPDTIARMREAAARRGTGPWHVVSPSGEEFRPQNLAAFCREHRLNKGTMCGVVHGRARHHRGWTCPTAWERSHPAPTPEGQRVLAL